MALAHAINKTELYETVYPGTPMPEDEPCSPVPPGLYFRTTEGLTCIEYDPEMAVELLDASGWVDSDGDGIRDKDGEKLSLLHCHTGAGLPRGRRRLPRQQVPRPRRRAHQHRGARDRVLGLERGRPRMRSAT